MKFVRSFALLLALFSRAGAGAGYPSRTTLVVPYPPGGGADAMARVVAERLSVALSQQVVVDNRGGGSGFWDARGGEGRARRLHAVLGHTGSISTNPSLYANAGYDPRRIAPIGLIVRCRGADRHPSFRRRRLATSSRSRKRKPASSILAPAVGTGGYVGRAVQGHSRDRCRDHPVGTALVMNDLPAAMCRSFGVIRRRRQYPGRGGATRSRVRSAPACCPTPTVSRACRASSPCCITACSRPPALRDRSMTSSRRIAQVARTRR